MRYDWLRQGLGRGLGWVWRWEWFQGSIPNAMPFPLPHSVSNHLETEQFIGNFKFRSSTRICVMDRGKKFLLHPGRNWFGIILYVFALHVKPPCSRSWPTTIVVKSPE